MYEGTVWFFLVMPVLFIGYGTQGKCEGSTFKPFPIKDIEQINTRRDEMGMSTAQAYWDMASERMCRASKH